LIFSQKKIYIITIYTDYFPKKNYRCYFWNIILLIIILICYLDNQSNPNGLTEIQAKILDIYPCNIIYNNKFNQIIIDYGIYRKFKDQNINKIIIFEGEAGSKEYKSPEMFEK